MAKPRVRAVVAIVPYRSAPVDSFAEPTSECPADARTFAGQVQLQQLFKHRGHHTLKHVLLADGSAQFLSDETSPRIVVRLIDPRDGYAVGEFGDHRH